jgi:hypothetical protein
MSDPSERIAAAFEVLSPDARIAVGEALENLARPFLSAVGTVLSGDIDLGSIRLRRALRRARTDGSFELIDRLSTDPPWGVVRECLIEAQLEQQIS